MKVLYFRRWTKEFDARLTLRRRMMEALGIAPKRPSARVAEDLRQTMLTCTACHHDAACAAWLEAGCTDGEPPEFCPNRSRFRALMADR